MGEPVDFFEARAAKAMTKVVPESGEVGVLAHIRWEAEAALSGLDNLSDAMALDSCRMSFEEIIDTLDEHARVQK